MIVRGTTENRDELTGNFGSALEDTSIGDYRLIALFAEKTLNAIFGVLQHYPSETGQHTDRGDRNEFVELARCWHSTSAAASFRLKAVEPLSEHRKTDAGFDGSPLPPVSDSIKARRARCGGSLSPVLADNGRRCRRHCCA